MRFVRAEVQGSNAVLETGRPFADEGETIEVLRAACSLSGVRFAGKVAIEAIEVRDGCGKTYSLNPAACDRLLPKSWPDFEAPTILERGLDDERDPAGTLRSALSMRGDVERCEPAARH